MHVSVSLSIAKTAEAAEVKLTLLLTFETLAVLSRPGRHSVALFLFSVSEVLDKTPPSALEIVFVVKIKFMLFPRVVRDEGTPPQMLLVGLRLDIMGGRPVSQGHRLRHFNPNAIQPSAR